MRLGGEPPCFLPAAQIGGNSPYHAAATVFLGLGTNLGDRARNLDEALRRIREIAAITAASSVYESEPVGFADQPMFWNMVVRCTTDLPARQLLDELIAIEAGLGRQRTFRNAPRIIDIDILIYDDVVLTDRALEIPHPRMHERGFVLRPLVELAPALADPRTGERYADILDRNVLERTVALGALSDLVTRESS